MIRLTIELLPGGSALRKRTLARFDVWNTSHLAPISNYAFEGEVQEMGGAVRTPKGAIVGHERDKGVLELVRRLLIEAATDSRESVSAEEKIVDLSSHLLMLIMTLDTQDVTPYVEAIVEKARAALKRSGK